MKQYVIYDSESGDFIWKNIEKCVLIREQSGCDIFLRFNGCTMRIDGHDDADTVYKKYREELHRISLHNAEKNGFIDWEEIKEKIKETYGN